MRETRADYMDECNAFAKSMTRAIAADTFLVSRTCNHPYPTTARTRELREVAHCRSPQLLSGPALPCVRRLGNDKGYRRLKRYGLTVFDVGRKFPVRNRVIGWKEQHIHILLRPRCRAQ